jgi:hypothetical protein
MWEILGGLASGVGSYLAAQEQRKAAEAASQAQLEATNRGLGFQQTALDRSLGFQQGQYNQGVDFQRQQLAQALGLTGQQNAANQALFAPYVKAGQGALGGLNQYAQAGLGGLKGQQALMGLLGVDAQKQAIAGIEGGPEFAALRQQGENAILQNASATGGLRGGNTQAALAQFAPQQLSSLIQQRLGQYGSLAGLGAQNLGLLGQLGQQGAGAQASGGLDALRAALGITSNVAGNIAGLGSQYTANVGNAYNANAASIADLLGQQGVARAGNALAQGQANANMWSTLGGLPNQAAYLQRLLGQTGGGALQTSGPFARAYATGDVGLDLGRLFR